MITSEDILNMNFYRKEAFTGSMLGMRYRICRETVDTPAETDCFRVWVWPGPSAFAAAADDVKRSADFPFTEEGRRQVVDWLNEQWAARKDDWAATMLH